VHFGGLLCSLPADHGAAPGARHRVHRRRVLSPADRPALGHLPLAEITPERVLGFVNSLAAGGSSRRVVEKTLAVLRAALSAAVEWGRLPANPARGIRVSRIRIDAEGDRHAGARERRVLSGQELMQLYVAALAPARRGAPVNFGMATLVRCAAEAALRRGELIGLRWGDVDLERRRLHVRRSVWHERERGGAAVEKQTKGRSTRVVPVSESLSAQLEEWYGRSVVQGAADSQGYVWPGRSGGPMAADTPTQYLERLLVRAGLVDDAGEPLVTLHGLRHGCGSLMLQADVPLIAVSRFLGHANVQVTAERYAHLVGSDEQLRAASDALESLLPPATLRETLRNRGVPGEKANSERSSDSW
jgi:integrase